ncbi:MAG: family peptidase [Patescibacteria group bacterium]|jgi:protease-4|nr:family peptidase [Patescibacteria group bacterium]
MKQFFVQLFKVAIFSSVGVTAALFTLLIGMVVLIGVVSLAAGDGHQDSSIEVAAREFVTGDKSSDNELLIIPISGVIMGEPEPAGDWLTGISSGITYGYEVKEQLAKASQDESIKGIFLYINSPGGTIFGSNAILEGVADYKAQTGKPVVAFVSGMAASGGYWASLAADEIIADTGSTIGSIGVIFGPFKYYDSVLSEDGGILTGGVVTEYGIQTTYITGGKYKDLGNPYRQLSPEEITTLQNMVNVSYEQFVSKVAEHRSIDPEIIKNQIGALVYSEQQAKELQLIDGVGSKEFSYTVLAQKANLGDDYQVTRLQQEPTFLGSLVGAVLPNKTPTASGVCPLASVISAYHGDIQAVCQ